MSLKTIAILAPNKISYSETFIQAHKLLPFNIKFYYGGFLPTRLEDGKNLFRFSLFERIKRRINKRFSINELALLNSLKLEKVDAVLIEYAPTGCESLKVLQEAQLPVIVHFHGFDAGEFDLINRYGNTYKSLFQYAKAVVVVSKQMADQVIALGCPPDKIHRVTYGASEAFFEIQADRKSKQFIALGRFVDKKAPYLTLASFKKLLEVCPEAKLTMGGDGVLLDVCKDLTALWGMNESVEFKGELSREEVLKYFASSLAFVQHSVTASTGDAEGTPVAIIEAMAAGLPVIATNHAGIPDIIVNNETGLLSEEKDIDAMANNMMSIFKESEFATRIGCNAKKYAQTHLTMKQYLDSLTNIINSIN